VAAVRSIGPVSSEAPHVVRADPPQSIRSLLRGADLESLPLLDGRDEHGRLQQGLVRAHVEPRHAAVHDLDAEGAAREIPAIHVRDLELAAFRWAETLGDLRRGAVVEVEPGDGVARL